MNNGEINIYSNCNEQDYYKQGNSFLEAAERCLGKKDGNEFVFMGESEFFQLPAPTVVNAAFACEMFLKSLIIRYKLNIPKDRNGHNLFYLYNLLPDDVKFKITNSCNMPNLESFFKIHVQDFVDMRYFIENKGFSNMSPISMYTIAFNLRAATKYLFITDSIS